MSKEDNNSDIGISKCKNSSNTLVHIFYVIVNWYPGAPLHLYTALAHTGNVGVNN